MDALKKIFPLAFGTKNGVVGLIINIIIHVVADAIAALAIALLSGLPLIGLIISLFGGLVGAYFTVSLVLSILNFLNIVK